MDLAHSLRWGTGPRPQTVIGATRPVKPMAQIQTRYYLRIAVADRPGVLAQIAKALGDHLISISSVIQKEVDEDAQTAEIVIMTHLAQEAAVQKALREVGGLPVVKEIGNFIRVEP